MTWKELFEKINTFSEVELAREVCFIADTYETIFNIHRVEPAFDTTFGSYTEGIVYESNLIEDEVEEIRQDSYIIIPRDSYFLSGD
jgi:methylthioribose-1-phosphate isomerase